MNLLPVALNVANKPCLVVGGGLVAWRKTRALLECEAAVTIIAPALCEAFSEETFAAQMAHTKYFARAFESGDCAGFALVFACTNRRAVNAQIADEARAQSTLCHVADAASESDFHGAATIRRGDICIGITTGGGSPALSKHLRARIEECVDESYAQLLEIMAARRGELTDESQTARAQKWREILDSGALELLRSQRRAEAEMLIENILNAPEGPAAETRDSK